MNKVALFPEYQAVNTTLAFQKQRTFLGTVITLGNYCFRKGPTRNDECCLYLSYRELHCYTVSLYTIVKWINGTKGEIRNPQYVFITVFGDK